METEERPPDGYIRVGDGLMNKEVEVCREKHQTQLCAEFMRFFNILTPIFPPTFKRNHPTIEKWINNIVIQQRYL